MIKASLSNLSLYYMSLFKIPKAMVERVDRIHRNFLWEGQGDKKKLHLLKWSEVIKSNWSGRSNWSGGLSLGSLEKKNVALLVKWWWRIGEKREPLWRRVIAAKYDEDKWGWWPNPGPRFHRSGLWGAIVSVCECFEVRKGCTL